MNNDPFLMGVIGMYIKDWSPNFNPKQAALEVVPIQVRLYNFPHEYWNEDTLKVIGDKLGKFLKADEAIERKDFNMYARICIEWKPHPPLPHAVEIRTSEGIWWQGIEVEEIIEQCKKCRAWDHKSESV